MKTKFFTFFVALFATTCLWAYDFKSGDLYYNITSNVEPYTVELTRDGEYELTSVTIPSTVDYNGITYNVTSIGNDAFYDCSALTSITIPNSVTSIGNYAFCNCYALTSVTIGDSVTNIGNSAFNNCSSLTSVTIPNSVINIGNNAFYNCSALTKTNYTGDVAGWCGIKLGNSDSNPMYYSHNFYINDQEIKDLVIPNTVDTIHNYAFYYCYSLASITIPNSVTNIGSSAFYDCGFLKKDFMNNSALDAEENNYWGALVGDIEVDGLIISGTTLVWARKHLTVATIPNYITTIGNYAFNNCSSLTSITIPNSVTTIGNYAFYNCSALTKTNYTGDVAGWCDIKFGGFSSNPMYYSHNFYINDQEIKDLVIPNTVDSIHNYAFYVCSSLITVTIGNSVTSIGNYAFEDCSSLTTVTIPDSVVSIGYGAFRYCSSLMSIKIPESVINIGFWAFDYTAFYNDNSNWENDELYIDNCLIAIKYDTKSGEYTIKDGVRLIAGGAFWDQYDVTTVIFPNSVKSISMRAFSGTNITSIVIPDSVRNIEQMAFYNCRYLTDVTLGNGITSIEERLFDGCSTLTTINIPQGVKNIGKQAFRSCRALEIISLSSTTPPALDSLAFYGTSKPICYIPCGTLASYQSSDWNNIASSLVDFCDPNLKIFYTSSNGEIVTPYNLDAFGAKILQNTYEEGQGVITFQTPITQIGNSAFYNCSSLTSITIPESVTKIGSCVFQNCSSLTELSIPSNCVFEKSRWDAGYTIILGCRNLQKLSVPASLFDVHEEDYLYVKSNDLSYGPVNLESLVINSGELSPLGWDFIELNRKTLKTINLGATTSATIAEKAFYDCHKLENLTWPSQLDHIPYMAVAECVRLKSIEIPTTVTEIDDRAFENCRLLSEVNFAEDGALTEIGNWAFYNCHELKNVVVPEGVTNIGHAAFYGCTYLESLTLPSSVQQVNDNGFALCAKMKKMHVNAVVPPTIQAKTFEDVNRSIPVYVPDESVEAYKSDLYWKEFNIQGKSNLPTSVENASSTTVNNQKYIRNGQLYILRDGKTYNVMGQEL